MLNPARLHRVCSVIFRHVSEMTAPEIITKTARDASAPARTSGISDPPTIQVLVARDNLQGSREIRVCVRQQSRTINSFPKVSLPCRSRDVRSSWDRRHVLWAFTSGAMKSLWNCGGDLGPTGFTWSTQSKTVESPQSLPGIEGFAQVCPFYGACVRKTLAVAMSNGERDFVVVGSARRRRERRHRCFLRHEEMAVHMALARAAHHAV